MIVKPRNPRRSYLHRGGETPLIGQTIDEFVRCVASQHGESEAVVSIAQRRRLTYAALMDEVQRVAKALIALGLEPGDRLGVWSTSTIEYVLLQLATARTGVILVNINPAYRQRELEHALTLARIQALLLIPEFRSSNYVALTAASCSEVNERDPERFSCPALPDLRHLIVYDPRDPLATSSPAPGFRTWGTFIAAGDAISDDVVERRSGRLDADDPVNIQFTSGTTGRPKAVMLTHHNLINNGFFCGEAMRFTERDRLCVPVPFYHCFGMVVSNLACFTHGATVVIPAEHFNARAALEAIDRERCTALHGVPTMFVAELEHEDFSRHDLGSLRTGIMAGAPCPPALMKRVMEEMGCREMLIAYGQTESSPVTHVTHPDDSLHRRTETVGVNLPHQEVKIVDPETGAIVPVGAPGEICFRGYHLMRGYYGDDDATRLAIDRAGWLHSGDLGAMEPDGYLRITGRLKDMIIRGGENIYPAEIEAFYFEHPAVAQVAVFGVPDEVLGEDVAMWVTLHEGEEITPDDLRAFARDRIAHYKVPRHIWIVDEFPMTVTGKIQKFRMRETAAQWLRQVQPAPA